MDSVRRPERFQIFETDQKPFLWPWIRVSESVTFAIVISDASGREVTVVHQTDHTKFGALRLELLGVVGRNRRSVYG